MLGQGTCRRTQGQSASGGRGGHAELGGLLRAVTLATAGV
jgi:hypothetical protein